MTFRSRKILERPEFSLNRCAYKAMGYSDEDLKRPIIGIANSWNDICPGHFNLRQLAEFVRKGIHRAGGTAAEFGTIACCDATPQGHMGMHFVLPSRDIIANSVEIMVQAHQLDAIVLLGSCDKIVPGMLMAAARIGIPAILLPGGPMLGGVEFDNRPSDMTSASEAMGMLAKGLLKPEQLDLLEDQCVPSCGSCSFLGTANTMCCLSEAMGMTLPDGALIPAPYADRLGLGEATGAAIVNLAHKNITARDIITLDSLRNAVRVAMAIGGSTNAFLHLSAIAYELGVSGDDMMRIYEEFSGTTPYVAKVNPASKYNMEHFHQSGGVPRVMKEIRPLLNASCMTVDGVTLGERLDKHLERHPVNREVIKTMAEPFSGSKGLAILRGNLAPKTAVTKPAAIDPSMWTFTGKAVVFDCEEDANAAILAGKIAAGDVVVIRYEGPKGGPGMREMYKSMKYMHGMGLSLKTALVTDGRFSGTNNGCFVGHISPEAAEGGALAIVRDGDQITIDIPNCGLHLHLSDEEIASRLKQWKAPAPKFAGGYLSLYSKLASSADQGAVLRLP
jgi:dihydroxy-acid dehydratase